ncbi:aldo/keto reductase [Microbispora triticiradicis]|uniref:aldo/keto reductase n=1 Tax=Microbispora triticiradicis TaxID=2200763 RepID=UPI0027DBEA12|nr:aldo/keto reductase [Microbispora triticiradicis]
MRIGTSDLDVSPLCLGGNPFGWTADETASFAVLDAYAEAGGNFIHTADLYTFHAPGNSGGESETIIGRWLRSRGCRDRMVIATKVGALPGLDNLSPRTIRRAVADSLRRLGTDHIDLYFAHVDDPGTPLAETLGAFDALVRSGMVRYIAASNFTADRLSESLHVATPIAGARNATQIADLLPFLTLRLTADELALLDRAGATPPAHTPMPAVTWRSS